MPSTRSTPKPFFSKRSAALPRGAISSGSIVPFGKASSSSRRLREAPPKGPIWWRYRTRKGRSLGFIRPIAREILAGIGAGVRVLQRVLADFLPGTDVVLAEREADAGADQPGRRALEVLHPVLLRPEDRAVVEVDVLVDEDVPLLREVGPEVAHAGLEARLEVDVEEGEQDRLLLRELRQRVAIPALDELAALERAVAADVVAYFLERAGVVALRVAALAVARLALRQALEGVVDAQLAADDAADEREI